MSASSMNVPRRRMLIAGAAFIAAASGGLWVALRSEHPTEWIAAVVRKHLPGVHLDEPSLQEFASRISREPEFRARKVALALRLDSVSSTLVRLAPEANEKIDRLERLVLTNYLARSNFFRVADPRAETIFCGSEQPVCGNPFAVFRNE